jgi:predicted phage tail protein
VSTTGHTSARFLAGSLRRAFLLVAETPIEAIRGLAIQIPGFWNDITKGVWCFAWGSNDAEHAMPAHHLTI